MADVANCFGTMTKRQGKCYVELDVIEVVEEDNEGIRTM